MGGDRSRPPGFLTFQDVILELQGYYGSRGFIVHQPYDLEKGAGTLNPATFLRALGPEPYKAAYVEPSRRPTDGRYGENPFRLQHYYQFQVIDKPAPPDAQKLYTDSLAALGIDLARHDIRFVEDDWEQPTFGAAGLGWEVWLDGMEVSQFTYFQQVGGIDLEPVSLELTYGLERIAMFIQGVDSVYDLVWVEGFTYGDVHLRSEQEFSRYNFDESDPKLLFALFDQFEAEAKRLLALEKPLVLPAYDYVLKCSHAFNLLDARKLISVTERAGYIGRVRGLAKRVAQTYVKVREEMGFPLLRGAGGALAPPTAAAPAGGPARA